MTFASSKYINSLIFNAIFLIILWTQTSNVICFVDSSSIGYKKHEEYMRFYESIKNLDELLKDQEFNKLKSELSNTERHIEQKKQKNIKPEHVASNTNSTTEYLFADQKYEGYCDKIKQLMEKDRDKTIFGYLTIPLEELFRRLEDERNDAVSPPKNATEPLWTSPGHTAQPKQQKDEQIKKLEEEQPSQVIDRINKKLANMEKERDQISQNFKAMQERYNTLFGASCLLCSVVVLIILYRKYYQGSNAEQETNLISYSYSNTDHTKTRSCSAKKDFKIGDEVQVRRTNDQPWLYGTIHQLHPTKVKLHGWKEAYAYEFNQIQHNVITKEKHPYKVPAEFIEVDTSRASSDDTRISFTNSRIIIISPTHSQKINTTSYEQIFKQHFRTTSSTNLIFDQPNTSTYTGRSRV